MLLYFHVLYMITRSLRDKASTPPHSRLHSKGTQNDAQRYTNTFIVTTKPSPTPFQNHMKPLQNTKNPQKPGPSSEKPA